MPDTPDSFGGMGGGPAFEFSTDRPEEALLFTDAIIAEFGDETFPVAQLARRAAAQGLVCWKYVTDTADLGDGVSFMGLGLIDGEDAEAYRIESSLPGSKAASDKEQTVILLFTYPDCQALDFQAG